MKRSPSWTLNTMLNCELYLNDAELYGKLGADPTLNYVKVKKKIDNMLKNT